MSATAEVKPYAVAVAIGEKKSIKEFSTKEEVNAFLDKARELKKKAPNLLVKIIRQPQPAPKLVKKRAEKEIIDDPREDCIAWRPIFEENSNKRKRDSYGKPLYQIQRVPQKGGPKVFYCPYCHAYKEWGKVDYGYGLIVNGCPDCEMSEQDFYIKSANGLWKMKG